PFVAEAFKGGEDPWPLERNPLFGRPMAEPLGHHVDIRLVAAAGKLGMGDFGPDREFNSSG
ncbi:hypothetical protein SB690_19650, partial [Bacillus sp. SIMBA_006]|uniref:hypothetical protein n=1 Tax=Bacillus sp. SIMBA_006 TaxID=3085755 RepID=UPI0039780578